MVLIIDQSRHSFQAQMLLIFETLVRLKFKPATAITVTLPCNTSWMLELKFSQQNVSENWARTYLVMVGLFFRWALYSELYMISFYSYVQLFPSTAAIAHCSSWSAGHQGYRSLCLTAHSDFLIFCEKSYSSTEAHFFLFYKSMVSVPR